MTINCQEECLGFDLPKKVFFFVLSPPFFAAFRFPFVVVLFFFFIILASIAIESRKMSALTYFQAIEPKIGTRNLIPATTERQLNVNLKWKATQQETPCDFEGMLKRAGKGF